MHLLAATPPAARPLPGTGTDYPTTVRGPLPRLDMPMPDEVRARMHDAVARGRRDASEWLRSNPDATDEAFRDFVVGRVGAPPNGHDEEADLQVVRDAVAARTPGGIGDAQWVELPGLFALWNRHAASVTRSMAADDAERAAALLADTDAVNTLITFAVKDSGHRDRPFQRDPEGAPLAPGITRVHGSSWTSGHASRAWANAIALGVLAPARSDEFTAAAEQVAWGRVYAAAHFPSDVVAGAYIGAAAATRALARANLPGC